MKFIKYLLAATLSLALFACGGDGDDSDRDTLYYKSTATYKDKSANIEEEIGLDGYLKLKKIDDNTISTQYFVFSFYYVNSDNNKVEDNKVFLITGKEPVILKRTEKGWIDEEDVDNEKLEDNDFFQYSWGDNSFYQEHSAGNDVQGISAKLNLIEKLPSNEQMITNLKATVDKIKVDKAINENYWRDDDDEIIGEIK